MRKKWPRLVIIWGNEWRDCRTDFETNLESIMDTSNKADILVIGAGHAGCEAAFACKFAVICVGCNFKVNKFAVYKYTEW